MADRKTLSDNLRGFVEAYSESFFPPLTEAERGRLGGAVISRASAAMGRHFAAFAGEAADALDEACRLLREYARDDYDARDRFQAKIDTRNFLLKHSHEDGE